MVDLDDLIERAHIRAADGRASPDELQLIAEHRVDLHDHTDATGDDAELVDTTLLRAFLGASEDEPTELTAFCGRRILVAHALTLQSHVRLLQSAQTLRGYTGCYQLVNGPINPEVFARYPHDQWVSADNGRVTDAHVLQRRAIFFDVDPVRVKGISSTDAQLDEARGVTGNVVEWLTRYVPRSTIAPGCSGNGFFVLVAIEPEPPTVEQTQRISKLLTVINARFGTPSVKIDSTVTNAARLMPCPGTWKRKGLHSQERPHRRAVFYARPATVTRVPLEAIA